MADDKDVYSFYRISDLGIPLRIKISSLVGKLPRHSRLELLDHPELNLQGSEVAYVLPVPVLLVGTLLTAPCDRTAIFLTCTLSFVCTPTTSH